METNMRHKKSRSFTLVLFLGIFCHFRPHLPEYQPRLCQGVSQGFLE